MVTPNSAMDDDDGDIDNDRVIKPHYLATA